MSSFLSCLRNLSPLISFTPSAFTPSVSSPGLFHFNFNSCSWARDSNNDANSLQLPFCLKSSSNTCRLRRCLSPSVSAIAASSIVLSLARSSHFNSKLNSCISVNSLSPSASSITPLGPCIPLKLKSMQSDKFFNMVRFFNATASSLVVTFPKPSSQHKSRCKTRLFIPWTFSIPWNSSIAPLFLKPPYRRQWRDKLSNLVRYSNPPINAVMLTSAISLFQLMHSVILFSWSRVWLLNSSRSSGIGVSSSWVLITPSSKCFKWLRPLKARSRCPSLITLTLTDKARNCNFLNDFKIFPSCKTLALCSNVENVNSRCVKSFWYVGKNSKISTVLTGSSLLVSTGQ